MIGFLVLFALAAIAAIEHYLQRAIERMERRESERALARLRDYDTRHWPPLRKY